MRYPLRRIAKFIINLSKNRKIVNLAYKIPYSRFSNINNWLFTGKELINYHGVNIEVNPGDNQGYYAYFFDSYEDEVLNKLRLLCIDSNVFVDVGANYGWLSLAIANYCKNIQIFAFEPDSVILDGFKSNLQRNVNLSNRISIVNKAVGNFNKNVSFKKSDHNRNPGAGRVLHDSDQSLNNSIEMITLDSFFKNRIGPDVIKIDVEGFEIQVLQGMEDILKGDMTKALLIETHGFYYGERYKDYNFELLEELDKWNLKILILKNNNWIPLQRPLEDKRAHLLCLNS